MLPQFGTDDTRAVAVHGDVVPDEGLGSALDQPKDSVLGHRIWDAVQERFAGKNRPNIDDLVDVVARPLVDHLLRRPLHNVELAPGVHAHDEVVVLLRGVGENRRLVDPGVVQQKVDFSELGDHVSDRGLRLLLARHIQRDMGGAAPGGANLLGDRGDALLIDVGNAHFGSQRSPILRDCGAHSLRAPCDQGLSAC